MATPFIVGLADFTLSKDTVVSIFGDVESAKQHVLQARRHLKSRQESAVQGQIAQSVSSASTPNPSARELQSYRNTIRLLLESESALVEIRSKQIVLQKRREILQDAILALRNEIDLSTVHEEGTISEPEDLNESASSQPDRKRQRYFESSEKSRISPSKPVIMKDTIPAAENDDLSSVVCPFELLGRCTDPTCPHMHLDR